MRRISAQPANGVGIGATSPLAVLMDFAEATSLTAGAPEVRRRVATVRRFLFSARIVDAHDITAEAITAYLCSLRRQGLSDKTLSNHRSSLSRFCDFLCGPGRQLLAKNPCRDVRLRKPEEVLPRYLDVDEVAVVLVEARAAGIWPEVCLALSTGLRMNELARLRWPDIDFDRRCLTVRKSKSRRPRTVPLSEPAIAALRAQRKKHSGKSNGCQYVFPARRTWRGGWEFVDRPRESTWWGRALRPVQASVPKFREAPGRSTGRGWHLFRHTFASRAVQAGVSLYKLAAWLGHRDVRTTKIYAHLQTGYDGDIEKASPPNEKGDRR